MNMNSQQIELYKRIQTFSFDQPETPLSFCRRLAKENGWSLDYAQRVIEEYKRLVFLAVVIGHPVTPSDQVDQAWHLHLSYTRSYWQEFCPKILQTSLHHDPTRGGLSEKLKYENWYRKTLESYQHIFKEVPPIDIWPDPKDRFGQDLQFIRVNTDQTWLIPKPSLNFRAKVPHQQVSCLFFLCALVVIIPGCQTVASIPNPLNFEGLQFLAFFSALSMLFVCLASCLRAYMRRPGRNRVQQPATLDAYETAYLVEGQHRVVDTAITTLVQKECVTVDLEQRILVLQDHAEKLSHPVEQAVAIAILSGGQIDRVQSSATQAIHMIRDRLLQSKLLIDKDQAFKARAYPAILFVALLGLGISKTVVGISRGKPIGFLVMMCIVISVIGLGFWLIPVHRSRYGDRVLRDLRNSMRPIDVVSQTDPQLSLAFALFGTAILPIEMFAVNQLFNPVSSIGSHDDGIDGCSSDCGSGCGGGCGGCSGD